MTSKWRNPLYKTWLRKQWGIMLSAVRIPSVSTILRIKRYSNVSDRIIELNRVIDHIATMYWTSVGTIPRDSHCNWEAQRTRIPRKQKMKQRRRLVTQYSVRRFCNDCWNRLESPLEETVTTELCAIQHELLHANEGRVQTKISDYCYRVKIEIINLSQYWTRASIELLLAPPSSSILREITVIL